MIWMTALDYFFNDKLLRICRFNEINNAEGKEGECSTESHCESSLKISSVHHSDSLYISITCWDGEKITKEENKASKAKNTHQLSY